MATYMVNCLHLIHTTIAVYEFTEQRLEILQAQVRQLVFYCYFSDVVVLKLRAYRTLKSDVLFPAIFIRY